MALGAVDMTGRARGMTLGRLRRSRGGEAHGQNQDHQAQQVCRGVGAVDEEAAHAPRVTSGLGWRAALPVGAETGGALIASVERSEEHAVTFSIFVAHPSALLTDHEPHGDGLVAHGFIQGLAARSHVLHVAAQRVSLQHDLPPNVHVHELGESSLPEPLPRLEYMRRMRRLFVRLRRTTRFDLVHQLNPVDVGLSLALPEVGVPVVLGPYVPAWPPGGSTRERVIRGLVDDVRVVVRAAQQQRATVVLLSTPAAASRLRNPPPRGLLVRELSPGIDERAWRPCDREAPGQDVLFLANLEPRKGILVLLEAFAGLIEELPKARLLVAGDGSQAEVVRRRLSRSPLLRRVELLGHVTREETPILMGRCAVYCLPSFGEPFGMTALEAMACGRALVVTDTGGLGQLVDERGGRRVPPGDARALAGALRELLIAPQLRRQMGSYNRMVVEQRYGWERVIDRLEGIYSEAVAAPRVR